MTLVDSATRCLAQARTHLRAALVRAWRHHVDLMLLALIVASYGLLGARFSRATPAFEGAEEPWQLAYAMGMTDAVRRFDTFETRVDIAPAWQPCKQPPLYGAISRLLVAALDPEGSWYVPNPFAAPWSEHPTSLNAVLHGSVAYAPADDVALALVRLRRLSWAAGMVTVLLCYAIARLFSPGARWPPLLAAALVAWNPFFLATSTQANAYALTTALATLALLLAIWIARGWRSVAASVALGLACGLTALLSPMGLATVILIPLAWLAPGNSHSNSGKRTHAHLAVSLAVALATAGWWYATGALGPRPLTTATSVSLTSLLTPYLYAWGAFGWLSMHAEPAYLAWMGVATLGALLLGLTTLGNALWQRRATSLWRRWCVPLSWGAVSSAAALLAAATGTPRAPFVWLLAFPSLALLGVSTVRIQLPISWQRGLAALMLIPLAITAWSAPHAYIAPSYFPPAPITLADVPLDIRDVALSFDNSLLLLGYQAPLEADAKSGAFDITLYWLCTDQPEHDYVQSLSAISPDGEVLGHIETLPANGTYPTTLWQPAEVIVERYRLTLEQTTAQPVAASLRIAVRRLEDGTSATAIDSHGNDLGTSASIGQIRVPPGQALSWEPEHTQDTSFSKLVTLAGYDVYPDQPDAGRLWNVTLYWYVNHLVVGDWNVFVHLVDAQGNLIAQGDGQPLGGSLPTSFWRPGDRLADLHVLAVPSELPQGPLYLRVGFYQLETGERLPVTKPPDPADPSYAQIGPFALDTGDAGP